MWPSRSERGIRVSLQNFPLALMFSVFESINDLGRRFWASNVAGKTCFSGKKNLFLFPGNFPRGCDVFTVTVRSFGVGGHGINDLGRRVWGLGVAGRTCFFREINTSICSLKFSSLAGVLFLRFVFDTPSSFFGLGFTVSA